MCTIALSLKQGLAPRNHKLKHKEIQQQRISETPTYSAVCAPDRLSSYHCLWSPQQKHSSLHTHQNPC